MTITTCDMVRNGSKSFLLLFRNKILITKLIFLLNCGEKRSYSAGRANDHHRIFLGLLPLHDLDIYRFF